VFENEGELALGILDIDEPGPRADIAAYSLTSSLSRFESD
jgi:hypothetical protein